MLNKSEVHRQFRIIPWIAATAENVIGAAYGSVHDPRNSIHLCRFVEIKVVKH